MSKTSPSLLSPPVENARRALRRIRTKMLLGIILPVPVMLVVGGAMLVANILLFQNAFLSLFLGLIFLVFAAGQITALVQFARMRPVLASADATLATLAAAGDDPDPEALGEALKQVPAGPLRDLMLRWLDLARRGVREGHQTLLENALEQQAVEDNRMLSLHMLINRTTLKLGFLGTLIGIILTFPPMKRAVLGLSEADGELRFVQDIALVIDADQYAILSTLVAMGISVLVEFLTLQMIERTLLDFELVHSHVNDWNALTLQPAISRRSPAMHGGGGGGGYGYGDGYGGGSGSGGFAGNVAPPQKQLGDIAEAMRIASSQLDQVDRVQSLVNRHMAELSDYERMFRARLEKPPTEEGGDGDATGSGKPPRGGA